MPKLAGPIRGVPSTPSKSQKLTPSHSADKVQTASTIRLKSRILIAAKSSQSARRPQPVETLFAVSRAVGSRLDLTEVLNQTTRELVRALAADFGSVWRVDPTDRGLRPVAGYRIPVKLSGASAETAARVLTNAAPEIGAAVYSENSANDPRFDHPLLRLLAHRSILIQPLRVRGEIAGMFAFIWTRARHRFNDVELRLVDAVTQQAGIAIENAELLTQVRDFTAQLEQRVRDRTAQLKQTNQELRTSKEELRALTTHIESVRERERSRIASEIHDELGQALTALKIDLARLSSRDAGEISVEAGLSTAIDEMIGTVRRISCELRPRILDDLGLQAALEWQAQELERRTGVKCRFLCRGLPCEIDAERSTALFRIFQEITTNITRHAEASRVHIALTGGQRSIRLVVRDNGRGIRLVPRPFQQRLGLLGMQERAASFGGNVTIAGGPGKGTTVRVRIPMPRGTQHDKNKRELTGDRRHRLR
jgi:signal transduction histidine kinase